MFNKIFAEKIEYHQQTLTAQALRTIANIPKQQILEPNLGSYTGAIHQSFKFQVAELEPDKKRGTRRTIARMVKQVGGPISRNVEVTVVDISIPFRGFPNSFKWNPAGGIAIATECQIEAGGHGQAATTLLARFDFDNDLETRVDAFIADVTHNLDLLRNQLPKIFAEVEQAYQAAISARVAQRRKELEGDAKFSFPISDA